MNTTKLKNLFLNPLAIAKFFYKKGIEDYALIQDFLYLTYLEFLKKEKKVLFEEKFQAWEDGPMLESVYRQMLNHYEEYKELDSLFAKTEDTVNEKIKSCLNKVYQDYQENKKRGKEIDFFFKTQDVCWESTREKSNNERRPSIFIEPEKIMALTK